MIDPPINGLRFYDIEKNQRIIKIERHAWAIIYKPPPPIRIIASKLLVIILFECILCRVVIFFLNFGLVKVPMIPYLA